MINIVVCVVVLDNLKKLPLYICKDFIKANPHPLISPKAPPFFPVNHKVSALKELEEGELKDKDQIPSFEEFMKDYQEEKGIIDSYELEVDSYKDIRAEKKFGPMPFRRDVMKCLISFQGGNHYLYKGVFRYENGTIRKSLSVRGIDEMKKVLQELEEGKIKVYREEINGDEIRYIRLEFREEETKRILRSCIEELENDHSWVEDESRLGVWVGGLKYQV